jgi:hypothetical protein
MLIKDKEEEPRRRLLRCSFARTVTEDGIGVEALFVLQLL